MATAVEPGSQPRTPSVPVGLPLASVLGAIYVVASIAITFYLAPAFWDENIAPHVGFANILLRPLVQLAALVVLVWFGRSLLGDNPPKGVHGGIFLVISWAITIFFLWRAVALNIEGTPGLIAAGVVALFLLYLALRFFTGSRGENWSIALEEQGWFSTAGYKRSLGLRVRRLTVLGILLLGGSGVYSLMFQGTLPKDWVLELPFDNPSSVTVLPDAQYVVPGLLLALTIWFAWRAVNVPTFAEFLIATEAEMKKVSWTSKKRLAQDTVVVLTTTLLLTLFLLIVDLFWGWLLSREVINVLPGRSTLKETEQVQKAKW